MINIDTPSLLVSQSVVCCNYKAVGRASKAQASPAPILCVRLLLPRPPLEEEPGQAQGLALPLVRFGPRIQARAD